MDTSITLRNAKTEQECTFENEAAAENFAHEVANPGDWEPAYLGADVHAASAQHVEVDLGQLNAAVAADTATDAAPESAAAGDVAPAQA